MRSLLLVSTDSDAGLDGALAAGADALLVDLGQSDASQARSRERVVAFLKRQDPDAVPAFVRIAPLSSPRALEDLDAIVPARPAGIVLPAATGDADVIRLSALLRPREATAGIADGRTKIIAAVDTPAGLFALGTYAAAGPRLAGLFCDTAALAAAAGARESRASDGKLTALPGLARSLTLAGAAAAGVAAIDGAHDDADRTELEAEAHAARRDGFAAKLARSAAEVAVINRVFTAPAAANK